jgi:hypothetical protein
MPTGYSVVKVSPFWEVVEISDPSTGKITHIVVDTMPRLSGHKPVKVHGPAGKQACIDWAKQEALLFLTIKGTFAT